MGRDSLVPPAFEGKLYLRRVRLDQGGYDQGGAYWGCCYGSLLYWAGDADETVSMFLRAPHRDAAKAKVALIWPAARFYR